jgi:hypothetical protein
LKRPLSSDGGAYNEGGTMSPDGLFAQLVPLVSITALICAVVFGISAIPRDEERAKKRNQHARAFFGRAEATPTADADTECEPVEDAPTWRGIDLKIFED